jgi:prepilin signal peptidase PulO-like enzyme (type II secretory pathway)
MSSSWEAQGPKSKLVDTHYHVGYLYRFVAVILVLGILFNLSEGLSFELCIVLLVVIALSIVHFRVSHAADRDESWVPVATTFLALPLLFGFPIGTYFGAKLMFNAFRLK